MGLITFNRVLITVVSLAFAACACCPFKPSAPEPTSTPSPASGSQPQRWVYRDGSLEPLFPSDDWPPETAQPVTAALQTDFDGNGVEETLALTGGRVEILAGGVAIWESPETWRVAQASISDFDRNDLPEAALLVWRPFQPWPIDQYLPYGGRIEDFHNTEGNSCHVILIGWKNDHFGEVWAGSAMADPLLAFAAADLDGDGTQELVALESRYDDEPGAPAWALSAWEWHGFGFRLLARVDGEFQELGTVKMLDGTVEILTRR